MDNNYQIFSDHNLLSPERRLSIIEQFSDFNSMIAREYLGRPDGTLFYDPLPDPEAPFIEYTEIPSETIILFFTNLFIDVYKSAPLLRNEFIQKLDERINANQELVQKQEEIISTYQSLLQKYEAIMVSVDECRNELNKIKTSRSWKYMATVWRARDLIIPKGSRRRHVIKSVVKLMKKT